MKNKKILIVFLLLFLSLNFQLQAQQANTTDSKTCLWEISNAQNEVYLLGSIHFLKQENYPLKPAIESAFNSAEILAFEVNMDSSNSPEFQQMIMLKGMYRDGNTLKKSIKQETYTALQEKAKTFGINLAQLEPFKPWFATVTIMGMKLQSIGFEPGYGIDNYFAQKAGTAKKSIIGLERITDQIQLFDELLADNQELLVLQTLQELDMIDKEIPEIVTAWQSGNVADLETTVLQSFKAFPEIEKKFLIERNMKWLPQIEAFCRQNQNYLVIVGAGHLIGKYGLVKLLQEKGYSIQQL